ncbi:MAG: hypothetical protein M3Z37_04185 [Candidatus Eremiobacteraeota bacterium]|nr:hypothetical protein [Candidatus Eremiobacteraeota bacterium]
MQHWSVHDGALQRRCELLAEAARARLLKGARGSGRSRITARKKLARVLLAFGYFLLDAGHSLDDGLRRPR